jgi:hypothetical protein
MSFNILQYLLEIPRMLPSNMPSMPSKLSFEAKASEHLLESTPYSKVSD